MGIVHATITFDARSQKEANDKIAAWKLHQGCEVMAIYQTDLGAAVVTDDAAVGAMETTDARLKRDDAERKREAAERQKKE